MTTSALCVRESVGSGDRARAGPEAAQRLHESTDAVSSRPTVRDGRSRPRVELQHDLDERLALGQLADEYVGPEGSPYVIMQVLDGAPEPWEKPGARGTRSGAEDESDVNPSAEAI